MRPQDDLFLHVNGRWLASVEIAVDRSSAGAFDDLVDGAEAAVRDLLEEARSAGTGSEARKVGDLYGTFLDGTAAEAAGTAPLLELVRPALTAGSITELMGAVGALQREAELAHPGRSRGEGLLEVQVDVDPGDPDRYAVLLEQGGLGLPDERYYRDGGFAPQRAAYLGFAARVLGLLGFEDGEARADRVLALETELAAHHWDAVAARDVQATYNPTHWSELVERSGERGDALRAWARALEVPAGALDTVVVREPSFVDGALALLTPERLPAWRDLLVVQAARSFAPCLPSAFVDAHFAFAERALLGTERLRPRWQRAVALAESAMGEAIGRLYVRRHYPPGSRARMDALVANLIAAYRESIGRLDWMGDATRARALAKLERFTAKIGHPDVWRDYAALRVQPGDLLGNLRRARAFEFDRRSAKIGTAVDRDEWLMTPQTVNAYYDPGTNEIGFPAAILQPPLFDPDRDDAANYGGIGAVIGHEIGHGFDDQGSRYDGDGRLRNWWTDADRAGFEDRTRALIAQHDALVPDGLDDHVDGARTIGENIGDLGGLGIAWKAYLLSLGGAEPPVLDGTTGAQRFFRSWAEVWREERREELERRALAVDHHAPPRFRCNQVVRNLDAFAAAFELQEGDALWLDPAERITIW